MKTSQTCFDVMQGMAGNIIHAIATTNAIVGGMIVVEALKVLSGSYNACRVRCFLILIYPKMMDGVVGCVGRDSCSRQVDFAWRTRHNSEWAKTFTQSVLQLCVGDRSL